MKRKVGLVLSGGFANGAYEFGVLKYLYENQEKYDLKHVIATSIGGLNAAAFISGRVDEAEKIWRSLDFSGLFGFYKNIIKDNKIDVVFNELFDYERLSESPTEFHLCVTTYPHLELMNFKINSQKSNKIEQMLKAAISIPKLMKPVEIDGIKYFDGGIRANTPLKFIRDADRDLTFYLVHFEPSSVSSTLEYYHVQNKVHELRYYNNSLKNINGTLDFTQKNIQFLIARGFKDAHRIFEDEYQQVKSSDKPIRRLVKNSVNVNFWVRKVNTTIDFLGQIFF